MLSIRLRDRLLCSDSCSHLAALFALLPVALHHLAQLCLPDLLRLPVNLRFLNIIRRSLDLVHDTVNDLLAV